MKNCSTIAFLSLSFLSYFSFIHHLSLIRLHQVQSRTPISLSKNQAFPVVHPHNLPFLSVFIFHSFPIIHCTSHWSQSYLRAFALAIVFSWRPPPSRSPPTWLSTWLTCHLVQVFTQMSSLEGFPACPPFFLTLPSLRVLLYPCCSFLHSSHYYLALCYPFIGFLCLLPVSSTHI